MGLPKAMLPFGSELLLQRVVRLLHDAVEEIVVVASPGQELPHLPPEVRVLYDRAQGRGPMEGLCIGLSSLSRGAQAAYVTGCDVPFLAPGFVLRLVELLGEYAMAVPMCEGYRQPLAAIYRREMADRIERFLAAGELCPLALFDTFPTRLVAEAELLDVDPELATLRNLNRPEEYLAALARAGFTASPTMLARLCRR